MGDSKQVRNDCCGLSSTGLYDIDANNITADNLTISSSLIVYGTNILSSLNNINTNLSTINTNLNNIHGLLILLLQDWI